MWRPRIPHSHLVALECVCMYSIGIRSGPVRGQLYWELAAARIMFVPIKHESTL
jgi:hypothetical protein